MILDILFSENTDWTEREVYQAVVNKPEYQEATMLLEGLIEKINAIDAEKNPVSRLSTKIEDAIAARDTVTMQKAYRKGFADGLMFLAGLIKIDEIYKK